MEFQALYVLVTSMVLNFIVLEKETSLIPLKKKFNHRKKN